MIATTVSALRQPLISQINNETDGILAQILSLEGVELEPNHPGAGYMGLIISPGAKEQVENLLKPYPHVMFRVTIREGDHLFVELCLLHNGF